MTDRRPAVEGETCCKIVYPSGVRFARGHVCGKSARIVEDGRAYCGTHDPERTRKRDAEREERWAARAERSRAVAERDAARDALVRAALAWGEAHDDREYALLVAGDALLNAIKAAKAAGVTHD